MMGKTKRSKVHLLWLVPFVPLVLALAVVIRMRDEGQNQSQAAAQTRIPVAEMKAGITGLLDNDTANLKYLRGADPATFEAVVKTLTDDEQKIIQSLLERKK